MTTTSFSNNHILQHIRSQILSSSPDCSFDKTIKENLYFITIKFKRNSIKRGSPSDAIRSADKWYSKIARSAFGPRLGRKIPIQPIGYVFVDYDGTRQSGGHAGYELLKGDPHVHAVLLLKPAEGQKYRDVMFSEGYLQTRTIESVVIEVFDPEKGSIENLISYCKKGYEALPRSSSVREDGWGIWPPVKPKKKARL